MFAINPQEGCFNRNEIKAIRTAIDGFLKIRLVDHDSGPLGPDTPFNELDSRLLSLLVSLDDEGF